VSLGVSTYEVSLIAHITAAIVGLGATFAESLTFPVAIRLDARHLPYKHRLQFAINLYLALPALVVLLPTGIYQASEAGYDLGGFWLAGAMGIVVLLALMIGIPTSRHDRGVAGASGRLAGDRCRVSDGRQTGVVGGAT
jgi:hypothetical protein